jgi:hypothetical protein
MEDVIYSSAAMEKIWSQTSLQLKIEMNLLYEENDGSPLGVVDSRNTHYALACVKIILICMATTYVES